MQSLNSPQGAKKLNMLFKANTLKGYRLQSRDGDIGVANEFYFDDSYWAIRYLVAETGNWLTGRQVLLSPYSVSGISAKSENISVDLTKHQIENSPSIESHIPVSEQFEEQFYGYYGYPLYWGGQYMWGGYPYMMPGVLPIDSPPKNQRSRDGHLRSTNAVTHYHIQANDAEVGHVEDFLIDEATWAIRYLVIDTSNWWFGKRILISPEWIEKISWGESMVFVNLTTQTIRAAPEYNHHTDVTRQYETDLYDHYGRAGYWAGEPAPKVFVL
jgi:hypothetical protein